MGVIYLTSPTPFKGVENLCTIETSFSKPNLSLNNIDALLCTSKVAVEALEHFKLSWKHIPVLCVGRATANKVNVYGGKVLDVPNTFYAQELARLILQEHVTKRILYLRAKEISFDFAPLLKEKVQSFHEEIVYETYCKKQTKSLDKNAIVIFTSPSTVRCFFSQYKWKETYKAIAIGKKTAKSISVNINVYLPGVQTIDACIALAKSL